MAPILVGILVIVLWPGNGRLERFLAVTQLRRIYRLIQLALWLLVGLVIVLFYGHRNTPGGPLEQKRQFWFRVASQLIGLKTVVHGHATENTALWVANHVSWVDIPLLGGVAPVNFLSKAEIRHWPLIGWLAQRGGTLFIKRGDKQGARQAYETISENLAEHRSILIFPEGTTSDGHQLRRFHARLLGPALDLKMMVQPVAIRYLQANGKLSRVVPFIDHQTFLPNLWRVLGEQGTIAEVHLLPALEAAHFTERKALAAQLQADVARVIESSSLSDV